MTVNNKANINNNSTGTLTAWVAYTPTFTGYGTVISISFFSRRVGDMLEIKGSWVCGVPTAVEARITIGYNGTSANVSSDATVVPSIRGCGTQITGLSAAIDMHSLIESNSTYLTYGTTLTKANGDAAYGVASSGKLNAKVPVTTWP